MDEARSLWRSSPIPQLKQHQSRLRSVSGWFTVCPQPLWANCGSVQSPPQQKIKQGKKNPKPTFFLHLNGISFCIHCVSCHWTPLRRVQRSLYPIFSPFFFFALPLLSRVLTWITSPLRLLQANSLKRAHEKRPCSSHNRLQSSISHQATHFTYQSTQTNDSLLDWSHTYTCPALEKVQTTMNDQSILKVIFFSLYRSTRSFSSKETTFTKSRFIP